MLQKIAEIEDVLIDYKLSGKRKFEKKNWIKLNKIEKKNWINLNEIEKKIFCYKCSNEMVVISVRMKWFTICVQLKRIVISVISVRFEISFSLGVCGTRLTWLIYFTLKCVP